MADDGDRHDIKAASTQRRERDGHAAKQLSDHLVLDPGHPRDRTMNLQVREAPKQSVIFFPSPREAPTAVRNTSFVRSFLGPHGQTHTNHVVHVQKNPHERDGSSTSTPWRGHHQIMFTSRSLAGALGTALSERAVVMHDVRHIVAKRLAHLLARSARR